MRVSARSDVRRRSAQKLCNLEKCRFTGFANRHKWRGRRLPFHTVKVYIDHILQTGGTVEIALGIAAYFAVTAIVVLFFRFANERDALMHSITAEWINESTQG